MILLIAVLLGDAPLTVAMGGGQPTHMFSNPLCGLSCNTPDPWVQMVGNSTHHTYFWLYTSMPLKMRKARTLAGLHAATPFDVWQGPSATGFWYAPTHMCMNARTHARTHARTQPRTHAPVHPRTHALTHSTRSCTHALARSLICWLVCVRACVRA